MLLMLIQDGECLECVSHKEESTITTQKNSGLALLVTVPANWQWGLLPCSGIVLCEFEGLGPGGLGL